MNFIIKSVLAVVGWVVGALAVCWGIATLVGFLFPNLHEAAWF